MVIPREPLSKILGHRRDYTLTPKVTKAYVLGILHDATVTKNTYRIGSKSHDFLKVIQTSFEELNQKSWIYKEGKQRNLWILEFSKNFLKDVIVRSSHDKIDYIRGYFDAEGGIAKSSKVRFYLYFCQKDKEELIQIKRYLHTFGIESGKIHNPSIRIDPDYWRFYIKAISYKRFAQIISSNHPDKFSLLRKKI